jgi:ATP adenylyltransferase
MKYIENSSKENGCPFCKAFSSSEDTANLIIVRGKKSFVMMNRFPYTTGHLMVLPVIHQELLSELDSETRIEMGDLIYRATEVLNDIYQPEGYNIGLNIGAAAGAGLPKHLHWHVVPRWIGDTNYMTTVGETRLIPEVLEDTYQKLISNW